MQATATKTDKLWRRARWGDDAAVDLFLQIHIQDIENRLSDANRWRRTGEAYVLRTRDAEQTADRLWRAEEMQLVSTAQHRPGSGHIAAVLSAVIGGLLLAHALLPLASG